MNLLILKLANQFIYQKMHTNNQTYTGVPIWSEYVSQTEEPKFSEPTYTDNKFIFDSAIYERN